MKITVRIAIIAFIFCPFLGFSQINSPYSRYGAGNLVPQASIANRAMGGISAASSDPTTINTVNPASLANLFYTNLDMGFEYDALNLKSKEPIENFKSKYAILSYLNVGIPLLSGNKKARKNKTNWALSLGLKPLTRINYKINSTGRTSIDSMTSLFEGSGGINEAFIGSAIKLKNFSFGFNTGYLFGEKDYSTRLTFDNDTVSYYKANYETKSHFGGVFLDLGLQYEFKIKDGFLRLGSYTTLKKSYSGTRDITRETFVYDADGNATTVDSIKSITGEKGKVILPATFGIGFNLEKEHFLIGADYETSKWSNYRYFGQKDPLRDSWKAKLGMQFTPASVGSTNYFSFVKYRAGFSFGKDYISVDHDLPVYTVSAGGAFPLRLKRSYLDNQFSVMNVTFEYGSRGNKNNNITESVYKISIGFSLSDMWFLRNPYQ